MKNEQEKLNVCLLMLCVLVWPKVRGMNTKLGTIFIISFRAFSK